MKSSPSKETESASQRIDERIAELGDWRGEMLSRVRAVIQRAEPEVVEEWKWRGTPVWSRDGMICTGETYRSVVKLTFANGAFLKDPSSLFNSSLEGNLRRAIDFREGDKLDARSLKALVREAVAWNQSRKARRAPKAAKPAEATKSATSTKTAKTVKRSKASSGRTSR